MLNTTFATSFITFTAAPLTFSYGPYSWPIGLSLFTPAAFSHACTVHTSICPSLACLVITHYQVITYLIITHGRSIHSHIEINQLNVPSSWSCATHFLLHNHATYTHWLGCINAHTADTRKPYCPSLAAGLVRQAGAVLSLLWGQFPSTLPAMLIGFP